MVVFFLKTELLFFDSPVFLTDYSELLE
jgi:hypothetical protein